MKAFSYLVLALLVMAGCRNDTIEDRRHGQAIVCHDGSKTLTGSNADNFVQLGHGDTPGPCPVKES